LPNQINQPAGKRAEYDLQKANQPKIMTESKLEDAEKIRIQGRLVKHPLPQPVSGGDPLRPFIIGPPITGEVIKKRDRLDLQQIAKTQDEGTGKNSPKASNIRPARR